MTIADFMNKYKTSMQTSQLINPLAARNNSPIPVAESALATPKFDAVKVPDSPTMGSEVPDWLQGRTSGAVTRYMNSKAQHTNELAQRYTDMAAGQVPVNEYGIPTNKMTDNTDYFNNRLKTVDQIGETALAGAEAKAQWQTLQNQANLNAGYTVNYLPAGAKGNSIGAQAVKMAMQYQGVPYSWGGESPKGFDCSGLVQYVYNKLGISLPRTTYEQAKSGHTVSLGNLLPGDLVFYSTGGSDPNGIGVNSHVGIYIGNGQIIDAPGRGRTVRITSINNPGHPSTAVRPW